MRGRRWERLYARYGPGAVVAGGSEGIGLAMATLLAEAGFDLVLVARRRNVLTSAARSLEENFGVTVYPVSADLGDGTTVETTADWMTRANAGLFVYNAAAAPVGDFAEMSESQLDSVVDVNCRGGGPHGACGRAYTGRAWPRGRRPRRDRSALFGRR